ncbi:MAG: flagellar basal body rod protein FlgB [Lachnospiraceae bacterium]|nr:flagellar basal body rod protein FlgB [Lachnospiraceae bacterium]
MISTGAYNYINVLQRASEASAKRHEVISNNIANVDTPNYKRQDVSFQNVLNGAIHNLSNLDEAVANIDLTTLNANVYTDGSALSYRLDGNNVDIETENAYLAENQIRYYTLIDSITQEFSRLQSVIK